MENKPSKNKQSNSYIKYSGMAFQMIATIILGVIFGKFLDGKFDTSPIFTALFSLFAVIAGMYLSLKDFIKRD